MTCRCGLECHLCHEPPFLSAREEEVRDLLSLGHSNKEIASHLGIHLKTVDAHIAHIAVKLGVRTGRELVVIATEYRVYKTMGIDMPKHERVDGRLAL